MSRKLLLPVLFALACGVTAVADDAKPDPKGDPTPEAKGKLGKLDKGKLFARLDADGDGKLTKDEFKKFGEQAREKLKDKGKGDKLPENLGDRMFEKLDANGDGSVSKEEFEKADLAGGRKGKLDPEKRKKFRDKTGA